MSSKKPWIRPLLLCVLSSLIVMEIVVLTPAPLEESTDPNHSTTKNTLLQDTEPSLIPDLPKGRVAEYGVEGFKYVSLQSGVKQWKLDAQNAFMYHPDNLVHGRLITAHLFDSTETTTLITGSEAKYFLNQKDLEIYGNVHTVFPDGFEIWSEYLRYKPNDRKILVPSQYPVRGAGQQGQGQKFEFSSAGLDYDLGKAMVILPQQAKVKLIKTQVIEAQGIPNETLIESDRCVMNRSTQFAYFTMNPSHPVESSFIHITQPNVYTQSRRAELNYGDLSSILQYLIAYDEVLIKETNPFSTSFRYATSGVAHFDTRQDTIQLTQFPQVYQDQDTVTGETILLHRTTGVIEIEHSNSFSQGNRGNP